MWIEIYSSRVFLLHLKRFVASRKRWKTKLQWMVPCATKQLKYKNLQDVFLYARYDKTIILQIYSLNHCLHDMISTVHNLSEENVIKVYDMLLLRVVVTMN